MPQYTVPIPGGGEYHVNASSQAAAYQNVGLTPPSSGGGGGGGGGGSSGGGGNPQSIGKNQYGDDIFNTPNGQKTGTQIMQELHAAGWDGQGNPVDVYNRTASGATGGNGGAAGGGNNPQLQQAIDAANRLDASYQKMTQALASGNAQAFEEAKNEFNKNFAIAEAGVTGTYNGNPTQAAVLQQANLTGQYNGQPTEATREFNTQQQEQARQFNANLANSLLNSAIQLRGPQDYLQYQQLTHGGANLLSQLTSPNAVPQTSPSATQVRPASISDIFSALGIGGGASSNPNDAGSQLLARFGLTPGQTLNPGQINPARYDQIGPIGQALTKNLAETLGYDPTDFENRINAQRPVGTAPGLTTTTYRQPTGLF